MSTVTKDKDTKRKEFEEYQKRKQIENTERQKKKDAALKAFEEYQSNRYKSEMVGWQKKAHTLIDSLYNDSQKRGESYQDSLTFSQYYNDNDAKIAELLKEGEQYGNYFGKQGDKYNDYNEAYKEAVKYLQGWQSNLAAENAHWSKWTSEEEYNADVAAAEEREKTEAKYDAYDADAGAAKIERLRYYLAREKELKAILAGTAKGNTPYEINAAQGQKNAAAMELQNLYAEYEKEFGGNKPTTIHGDTASNSLLDNMSAKPVAASPVNFEGLLNEAEAYDTLAKRYQNKAELEKAPQMSDFTAGVAYGKAVAPIDINTVKFDIAQGHGGATVSSYFPKGLEAARVALQLRENDFTADNYDTAEAREFLFGDKARGNTGFDDTFVKKYLVGMSEEQFDNLAYYLYVDSKNGTHKAEEYIDAIADDVNREKGNYDFESSALKDSTILQKLYALPAGLDTFATGIRNLGNDEYVPTSPVQYTSSRVSGALADNGLKYYNANTGKWEVVKIMGKSTSQLYYEANTSVANMLPALAVSAAVEAAMPTAGEGAVVAGFLLKMAPKVASGVVLGSSAAGHAKNEMLELGYSKEIANNYGVLVGASEAGLEMLMGSIPGLSLGDGIFSKLGEKAIGSLDNVLGKAAYTLAKYGITWTANGLDEATEEGIQTCLESWFKEVVTKVDFESPDAEEVAYSMLLGYLTGAGFSVGGDAVQSLPKAVSTTIDRFASGSEIKSKGQADAYVQKGLSLEGTRAYDIARKTQNRTDNGKRISNYSLGKLAQSFSDSQMSADFQTKIGDRAISESLTDIVKGRDVRNSDLKKVIGNEAALSLLNETLGTDIKAENSLDEARDIISKAFESSEDKTPAETKIDRNRVVKSLEVNLPSEKAESLATIIADIGNGNEVSDKQIASVLNNKYARNALNKYLGRTADNKFTESSKASDVRAAMAEGDYSRQGQAVLFGSILGMSGNAIKGLSAVVANSHADVASIARAYNVVYKAAKSGKALADVSGVEALSPTQKLIAYEYGVMDGLVEQSESKKKATAEAEEAATTLLDADKTAEAQKKIDNAEKLQSRKEGKVIYEGDRTKLSSLQKRSLHALDSISKALGVTFHIFESQEVDGKRIAKVNGKETSANGWYDTKTGEIWIDINAGVNGDGLIIWTASHELTHFIKQWSPEKFKVFADFLLENYAERGISKDALIDRQIAKAKKNGREISRDEALEEVIADSCETFLLDSNAAEKIIELRNKDKSLAQKILDFLKKALRDIKAMLKGVQPDSYEGKLVSEMTGTLQQLHDLWADALADASEAYSTTSTVSEAREDSQKLSDRDTEYLDAVNRGDMETAQRMVDEAAKEAGYTVKAYHGTSHGGFNVFDTYGGNFGLFGMGSYFTENRDVADSYQNKGKGNQKQTYSVFLKSSKTLDMDATANISAWENAIPDAEGYFDNCKTNEDCFRALKEYCMDQEMIRWEAEDLITGLISQTMGYNAITHIGGGRWNNKDGTRHRVYIVFDPEQVKSADPVTYDDNGNVIPLSERFNSENDDIRYSDRDPDALTNREILANMLDSVAESDRDKAFLDKYKARLEQIEKDKAEIARLKEEKKGAEKLRREVITSKIEKLEKGITESEKWLKNLEETATLKRLVSKEREAMYAEGVLAGQMAQGKADAKVIRKQQEKLDKEKQKRADMLAEYRARVAEREQRIKEKYQEAREKSIEGRNKTEVRNKIKRVIAKLHRLLTSDSKEKHVPSGLKTVVADALSIINMDTVGAEKRIKEYDERIAKATDPIVKESLINTRNEIEAQGVRFAEKIAKLQDAYAQIKKDASADVRSVYSEDIEEYIKAVREQVGDTSIKDMDIDQLEAVYEMFTIILKNVRDGNKLFLEGRSQTVAENSMAVDLELSQNGKSNKLVSKNGKLLKKFSWSLLKPVTFMKTLGSKTFTKLYENIRKGEDTWAVDVNEAKNFFSEMRDKYKFDSWDFEKKYDFADDVGNKFSLTVEQIMSLYAYSKRDKADLHLEKGGFVFDSSITVKKKNKLGIVTEYYVNDATPYRLSKETVKGIVSKLSKDMTDFVDEMQAYLSDVMGEKGNEISMKMYDIRLFKEKNYFPLKTSQYFREFDPEKGATPKIKNSGFTHKTMPGANNPIILSNFMDVWANHVNDMSMYHAFTLPIEDFMRVYNYNSRADGFNAIKQKISQYYGDEANKYIQTLIDQLNSGARSDPDASLVSRGIAAFKKAKTFVSASVVIQQPSALARAWAYIDPKYFIDKPKATSHDKTWAEVKEHAPVAIIKEMGRFDSNMGRSTADYIMKRDYKTIKEKATGIFTDKEYRDDILSKAPALADELAWCAIWKAVKREVAATTDLEVNSTEYFERCGERFTEIIENTQVYDSVLSKSEIMRSKDSGLKMVTAFAAEPITTLNMMVDAIVEGKRGRKSFARRSVGAVATSIVLNSILVSIVYAARDDDEDETYAEKYLASLTAELVDGFNPLTYVPLVRDIWSVMQGYDIARTDMSMIGDIWNSVEGLFSTSKSGFDKVSDLVGNIAAIFGVPADNIMRDAKAIYNVGELIYNKNVNDLSTTKWGVRDAVMEALKNVTPLWSKIESYTGNKRTKYDELYEAMMSGDETYIKRAQSHFAEDDLESGIKRGLKDNDVRIEEAARAYLKGDVRRFGEIIDTIAAEGVFDAELVESVVRSEINKLKPDTVTEETVEAATSIYKTSDINVAFDSGDIDTALDILAELIEVKSINNEEKIRKEAEEKGENLSALEILASAEYDARSSIRSSITSYWKPLYVEASKAGNKDEMDRIYDILLKTGLYGDWRDLEKTLKDWRK